MKEVVKIGLGVPHDEFRKVYATRILSDKWFTGLSWAIMTDQDSQHLHENYRHFRNSAVALSVTIIGVSGAMLVRLEQLQTVWFIKGPFQITFVVCIILSLLLQYRHYQGYMNFTLSEFFKLILQMDP